MSSSLIDTEAGVFQLLQQQADELLNMLAAKPAACCWDTGPHGVADDQQHHHPESIDTGASGFLLLYIELYKRTGQAVYLQFADEAIMRLLTWCSTHPTENYALYNGRAGVAYILLQRYLVNRDESFLQSATELMRASNGYYLHSKYTTDYLYNGRAGTLLVLIHLYRLSGEAWLPEYIATYTNQLLLNAQLSDEGIYWMAEEEINCRPSCAFAYGSAGIQYVLQQADPEGTCEAIQYVLQQASHFTKTCWRHNDQGWGDARRDIADKETLAQYRAAYRRQEPRLFEISSDESWAYGTAGIVLAMWSNGTHYPGLLIDRLIKTASEASPTNSRLHDGWTGMALSLLPILQERGYQNERIAFTAQLQGLMNNNYRVSPVGGLMHGDAGRLYCLLQVLDPHPLQDNILLPFAMGFGEISCHRFSLSISVTDVRTEGIRRQFPRMINLLQLIAPRLLKEFMDTATPGQAGNELSRFIHFMQGQWMGKTLSPLHERLADLFSLELQKFQFYLKNKSSFHVFLQRLTHNEEILGRLNEPEAWLYSEPVMVSPNIQIVFTKWNWSLDIESEAADYSNMLKKHMQNLAIPPGEFEYVFTMSNQFEHVESCFETAYRALLHRFDEPKTLGQAIGEIKFYMDSLPQEERDMLLLEIGVLEDSKGSTFIGPGQSLVLNKLKSWIHRDILSFQNQVPGKD